MLTVLGELKRLAAASELYVHVLRAVAMGYNKWSPVKRAVETWMDRYIYDETLRRVVNRLIAMSLLKKENEEYKFLDPICKKAAERL